MPTRLRVATYNVHAGVDGWGRATDVVDVAVGLDADVLFLQESWRDDTVDLAAEIAARSGGTHHAATLAEGWRATGGTGPPRWQHRFGLLVGGHGLFLDSVHPLHPPAAARLAAAHGATRGSWGTAIVTRLPVTDAASVTLTQLPRDLARRVVTAATLETSAGPLVVVCVHAAHLRDGSRTQLAELARWLEHRVAGRPGVLGGDLNCWGPVARRALPGWRQAVRGRTWPAWRPHSQVDHVFVRGAISVGGGRVVDARASDHRPVVAELELDRELDREQR